MSVMVKKTSLFLLGTLLILLFLAGFGLGHYIKSSFFEGIASYEGKTNFLLLGVNGNDESGADLTDTIIFASLNAKSGRAVLLSIPRDLWVKEIQAKINTTYHYGGFALAKKTVAGVVGQPVDYILVLNFDGFEKAVDILGGVEVEVGRSFDDYEYPIAGKENDPCGGNKEFKCRYEHLRFEAGKQLMDGKTALKFVRSRNAEGEEGTDFARSLRQQKFLEAFRQKLSSPKVYLRPVKLYQLWKVFQRAAKTDINSGHYGDLALLALKINWQTMKAGSLADNLLVHPKTHYSRQWVLLPKKGDWREVWQFVGSLLR
jgi:anionic cell wall polymer biosynthesis LytR-Cps2A-Psr (LCP) family protein